MKRNEALKEEVVLIKAEEWETLKAEVARLKRERGQWVRCARMLYQSVLSGCVWKKDRNNLARRQRMETEALDLYEFLSEISPDL